MYKRQVLIAASLTCAACTGLWTAAWLLARCGLSTNPCGVTHRALMCEQGNCSVQLAGLPLPLSWRGAHWSWRAHTGEASALGSVVKVFSATLPKTSPGLESGLATRPSLPASWSSQSVLPTCFHACSQRGYSSVSVEVAACSQKQYQLGLGQPQGPSG